ncbi:hypothetical protein BBJ28_00015103 [Nothophytophthora sp. Chile5]|nr:hypothetical protein BBJ28_00015103 [Nothophytophthora sp. Chile5]
MERSLAALPCGHVFHEFCALQALERRHTCPVCRSPTSTKKVVRLYFTCSSAVGHHDASVRSSGSGGASEAAPASVDSMVRLSDRLKAISSEMRCLKATQRMLSSRSFRVEADLVTRQQQLERAELHTQRTLRELETTKQQLRMWQRIGGIHATASTSAVRVVRGSGARWFKRPTASAPRSMGTLCPAGRGAPSAASNTASASVLRREEALRRNRK